MKLGWEPSLNQMIKAYDMPNTSPRCRVIHADTQEYPDTQVKAAQGLAPCVCRPKSPPLSPSVGRKMPPSVPRTPERRRRRAQCTS